jgi:hypothetical protein
MSSNNPRPPPRPSWAADERYKPKYNPKSGVWSWEIPRSKKDPVVDVIPKKSRGKGLRSVRSGFKDPASLLKVRFRPPAGKKPGLGRNISSFF